MSASKETAKSEHLKLRGEFVVSVGDAVVMELDPDEVEDPPSHRPGAADLRLWELTYDSPDLHGIESIIATRHDVETFVAMTYFVQRSCTTDQHDAFPKPLADVYDAAVYVEMLLRANDGHEAYQSELDEAEESERFKTVPSDWVADAIRRGESA